MELKQQHPAKREVDEKKELQKCMYFSQMCRDTYRSSFFERKLKDGM